ncbi:MAG: hypothetical protein LBG84_04005 [Treponema sp.]|nr:hypothetical protein [Treponema sp.]
MIIISIREAEIMRVSESRRRIYRVNRFDPRRGAGENGAAANVDCFPWGGLDGTDDYRPATSAGMAYTGDSLLVFMETAETGLRIEQKGFSGQVYTDSCMELFLMPDPENSRQYLNWEFNPAGAMYLSLGKDRYDRLDLPEENYRELFQVKTLTGTGGWSLEYRIPLSFLRRFFPSLEPRRGRAMRGNFYKCGDKTARPHFGCWSPIDLPRPDFHCPDFFGDLIIGEE